MKHLDRREWILELLVKPLVSQALSVVAYSASDSETVSIAKAGNFLVVAS